VSSVKDKPPHYAPSESGASAYSGYSATQPMQNNRMSMINPMQQLSMSHQFAPYPMDNRMSLNSPNFSGAYNRSSYAQASPLYSPKMAPAQAPSLAPTTSSNGLPSDEALLKEIGDILTTADLMTLTKKQVRETLSARFGGIDLKPKREVINKMIDNILKGL
jgi:hypothetical protein